MFPTGFDGDNTQSSASTSPADPPIDLAIIANSHAPYRAHLHHRIVREMPGVRLWSLYTHEGSNAAWAFDVPPEIRPVSFGVGESSEAQTRAGNVLHEWRKGGRIIRWLMEHRVKAVVVNGYNDACRLRIIRWCRRNGVTLMVWGDSNIKGDQAAGAKAVVKRQLVSWVVRQCDAVLPCGTLGKAFFKKYGAAEDRIFYFPVEPDYALIQRLPSERIDAVRRRFQLDPNRRRMVFSGRLVDLKRVDLVIDGFLALAAERPEWDLVIIGDGPLRESLEARVPAELSHRVTWTGFFADQADVSAIYRLSDVLLLLSTFEPWALVVNEAAAAGMAMICSDVVGAAAELVKPGVNGFLTSDWSVESLVAPLRTVTDPNKIDQFKLQSFEVLHDWQRNGDPIKGLRAALKATVKDG